MSMQEVGDLLLVVFAIWMGGFAFLASAIHLHFGQRDDGVFCFFVGMIAFTALFMRQFG